MAGKSRPQSRGAGARMGETQKGSSMCCQCPSTDGKGKQNLKPKTCPKVANRNCKAQLILFTIIVLLFIVLLYYCD